MCRTLRVLCAAATPGRLTELKRAAVSAQWELVGGATSVDDLLTQIEEWNPDVLVIDRELGPDAERSAREAKETLRIVVVETPETGPAGDPDSLRDAILTQPKPGGPVRS